MDKLSLGKKMVVLAVGVVIAILIIFGNAQRTNSKIKGAQVQAKMRAEQLDLMMEMDMHQLELMLAAMDSIIDRADGKISDERMQIINETSEFFSSGLSKLTEYADTAEEKKLADKIKEDFPKLEKTIRVDLKHQIEENAIKLQEIEDNFTKIDDNIDEIGGPIEEALKAIFNSVTEEQKEASELSDLRNRQIALLNDLIRAHGNLMLAAMDSIIDKDEGIIDEGRQEDINTNISFFSANFNELKNLADTGEEKRLAENIVESFPKLAKGIQVDLVNLIETKASQEAFTLIDDALDNYGDPIEGWLVAIYKSVQDEQKEANEMSRLRNEQLGVVNTVQLAHGALMLNAMDAIIDKDEGNISKERYDAISENAAIVSNNLKTLVDLADTDEEKDSARKIQKNFPILVSAIQVDLKNLIEESAVLANEIEAGFDAIDDHIDEYGGLVMEDLEKYIKSVQEEAEEEAQALDHVISNSSRINLIAFLIILGLVLPLIYFLARSIIGPIENVIGGLNSSSDQVTAASGQVAQSSQSMAEGASEQASSLEEISSSLEEMSSMTKQNADNAKQASVMSNDAKHAAEQGNSTLLKMSNAIKQIKDSSDETAKIIKTIDEIAFQTNLLALNAAVEAARAGEAGKGFAVVAEEVRNLAQRSAEAAKNTSNLIEGSQKNADNGVQVSNEVAEIFSTILTSTNKVTTLIDEVSQASNEQAQGIEQVNTAVSNMDQVTQANAANAEESASAGEELSAQAQEMQQMVNHLIGVIRGAQNHNGMQMSAKSFAAQDFQKPAYKKPARMLQQKTGTPPAKRFSVGAQKVVNPEEVIPLGDDDLNDF